MERKILNNPHLHHDPFIVPEGYFEQFSAQFAERICTRERQKTIIVERGIWQHIKPWLSAAVLVIIVSITTHTMKQHADGEKNFETVDAITMIADAGENDGLYDYLMLNSENIYEAYNESY